MRLPKRGERGFTLIELLIVVAILGVLAAVVIPNVTRFVGAGEEEAAETELHNMQLAVTSMMLENGITSIPGASGSGTGALPLNAMISFPDAASGPTTDLDSDLDMDKLTDPNGDIYGVLDGLGYVLYGHDITADNMVPPAVGAAPLINYVTVATTTYYYTCDADGMVKQYPTDTALP